MHHNNDNFQLTSISLKPTPDGPHIITHPKKQKSTILTNFIISMDDEHAYAMLATLEGPIRTQLRTLICIRGTTHSQVVHIQFNPHPRNILSRTYHHMFMAPGTQELVPHITLPKYNNDKGLVGRRIDKIL
jgi:hypothetical protein